MNYTAILNPSFIRPLTFKWKLSRKTIGFLGFSLVVALIGFYIFQINEITQASFFIANYEKQVQALNQESQTLEISFSGLSSAPTLEALLASANYEKVGKVYYIQMLEGMVAAK